MTGEPVTLGEGIPSHHDDPDLTTDVAAYCIKFPAAKARGPQNRKTEPTPSKIGVGLPELIPRRRDRLKADCGEQTVLLLDAGVTGEDRFAIPGFHLLLGDEVGDGLLERASYALGSPGAQVADISRRGLGGVGGGGGWRQDEKCDFWIAGALFLRDSRVNGGGWRG